MLINDIPFGATDWAAVAPMSYQVADDDGAHRSHTEKGARLFIVD